jgi:hypothetical protein
MSDVRRHTIYLSDLEIRALERAVLAYAKVMSIQVPDQPRQEADLNARVGGLVQEHRHCTCPSSSKGGS